MWGAEDINFKAGTCKEYTFFIFASCESLKRLLYVLQNTCTRFIGFFLTKIYKAELYEYNIWSVLTRMPPG